ncbi:hypothetical protein EZV62_008962 [Acer yangbiense]|uniref:Uncharacterized protein n=1 Tax=Acer yangbiense TaxID=1000413 RepID=A0A5C7IED7_9ROSI|nr:hypothetical protein EZV62_008962 [Acer yangbiense]
MKEDLQSSIFGSETALQIWTSLEEQLLPVTIEKEGHLKGMLMTIQKGSRSLEDYLRDFKSICDNLAAIKKPVPDLDMVFQFAPGLVEEVEDNSTPRAEVSLLLVDIIHKAIRTMVETLATAKQDRNQRTIAKGHKRGQLYTLDESSQEALNAINKDYDVNEFETQDINDVDTQDVHAESMQMVARPTRTHRPPTYLDDFECHNTISYSHALTTESTCKTNDTLPTEPKTLKTAFKDTRWVDAMHDVFLATWELSFKSIKEEETSNVIKTTYSKEGSLVNLSEKIFASTYAITARAAFGNKSKDQQKFILIVMKAIELASGFSIADLYPSIGILEVITGMKSKIEKLHQERDRILGDIIDEHKERRQTAKTGQKEADEEDLIDVFLRLQEDGDLEFPLTNNNIKAVIWRFLDSSLDYKGMNLTHIPFGAGRRICPSIQFAIPNIELPLAQLLYHFDWKLPNGMKAEDLDMTEAFGLTVRRKKDLMLIPIRYCPCPDI